MTVEILVTPEQIMARAAEGQLSKHALASLLTTEARTRFYDACGAIELRYTNACRALGDPCLESGCSAEGERCLQPILRAGTEYHAACGSEWAKLFADAANRDRSWRHTVSIYDLADPRH